MGIVSNIERYALNDGVGVRTTVFLKGCPLRCKWCCNPETQQFQKELMYFQDECIGCGLCIEDCPYGALKNSPVPKGKSVSNVIRKQIVLHVSEDVMLVVEK